MTPHEAAVKAEEQNMKNYELIDAARTFLRLLGTANEDVLNETYQRLANEANDSEYGQAVEPRQGLCVAFQAEQQRRLLMTRDF